MSKQVRRIAALAVTATLAFTGTAATASAADPILFVHGWSSSGSVWNTMIGRFQADGFTRLYNWNYNTAQSNATTAYQLRDRVNSIRAATGAAKVDIITHSMGGLSSRYYAKFLGGTTSIDEWVSLGGPNHGTNLAAICWIVQTSCVEMTAGSSFLANLNYGDETPGAVRYGTWWSPCDEVINPDTSTILSGAYNTQTSCMLHSGYLTSSTVYGQVRNFVW